MEVDQLGGLRERPWWWPRRRQTVSCLTSCLVHATLLVVLALIVDLRPAGSPGTTLTATLDAPSTLDTLLEESPWEAVETKSESIEGNFHAELVEAERSKLAESETRAARIALFLSELA